MFKHTVSLPGWMLGRGWARGREICSPQDQRFSLETFGAASAPRRKGECEDPFISCMQLQDIDNDRMYRYLQANLKVFRDRVGTNANMRNFENIKPLTSNLVRVLSDNLGREASRMTRRELRPSITRVHLPPHEKLIIRDMLQQYIQVVPGGKDITRFECELKGAPENCRNCIPAKNAADVWLCSEDSSSGCIIA